MGKETPDPLEFAFGTIIREATHALGKNEERDKQSSRIVLTQEEIEQCKGGKADIIASIRERLARVASYTVAEPEKPTRAPDVHQEVTYEIPLWLRLAHYRAYTTYLLANGCTDTPVTPGYFSTNRWIAKAFLQLQETGVTQGSWVQTNTSAPLKGVFQVIRVTEECKVVLGQKRGGHIVLVGNIGASYISKACATEPVATPGTVLPLKKKRRPAEESWESD